MPQRPMPPGKLICTVRVGSPCRQSPRPSSAAVRPCNRSTGWASNRSPARFTRRNCCASSNANTARLISSITFRSSALASSAPRRCSRSVSLSAFTSNITSPSGSSRRAPRARTEKSSSRRAESRLETVCRGCTTRSRAAQAKPHDAPSNNTVSDQRVCDEKSPRQSSTKATIAAGKPESSASSRTRRWWVSLFGTEICYYQPLTQSQSILFQPSIKGAAAQAERFGGLHRVAVATCECLFDQIPLDLVQAHVLEARRGFAIGAQTEVGSLRGVALRHQHGALDRVVQFADVARPAVLLEQLQRRRFETGNRLAVTLRALAKKVGRQRR